MSISVAQSCVSVNRVEPERKWAIRFGYFYFFPSCKPYFSVPYYYDCDSGGTWSGITTTFSDSRVKLHLPLFLCYYCWCTFPFFSKWDLIMYTLNDLIRWFLKSNLDFWKVQYLEFFTRNRVTMIYFSQMLSVFERENSVTGWSRITFKPEIRAGVSQTETGLSFNSMSILFYFFKFLTTWKSF